VWLDGRDLGLQYFDHVAYFHAGHIRSIPAQLRGIFVLRGDERRMSWMESDAFDLETSLPKTRIRIRSLDLRSGEVTTVREAERASDLVGGKRFLFPVAFSISPDGNRIAFSGLVDASPPGTLERAFELEKKVTKGSGRNSKGIRLSPEDAKELKELQKMVRFDAVTATTQTIGGPFTVQKTRLNPSADIGIARDMRWSRDGRRLAVVYGSDAEVLALD
jgi:hypothetical protein